MNWSDLNQDFLRFNGCSSLNKLEIICIHGEKIGNLGFKAVTNVSQRKHCSKSSSTPGGPEAQTPHY